LARLLFSLTQSLVAVEFTEARLVLGLVLLLGDVLIDARRLTLPLELFQAARVVLIAVVEDLRRVEVGGHPNLIEEISPVYLAIADRDLKQGLHVAVTEGGLVLATICALILIEGPPFEVGERVDELVHVEALGAQVVAPSHEAIGHVCASYAVVNNRINRVLLRLGALHGVNNARKLLIPSVHQVVEVAVLFTSVTLHRQALILVWVVHELDGGSKILFGCLELEIIEKAHELPLAWLEGDLAGEVSDAKLLDELENVDLLVELGARVLLKPVVALTPHLAAEEPA